MYYVVYYKGEPRFIRIGFYGDTAMSAKYDHGCDGDLGVVDS